MNRVSQTSLIVGSALALVVVGVLFWKKKKRTYVKVGKVSKLYFFPVKSLKHVEVDEGRITKLGFEVNGLLERSFMVINADNDKVSQREAPLLVNLVPEVNEDNLTITAPSGKSITIKIKRKPSENDVLVKCKVFTDETSGIDCGDPAAEFFELYLGMPGVRLVQFFPELPPRSATVDYDFIKKIRKENPIAYQDLVPIHILSQASVDDINSKVEGQDITVLNFRPNILFDGCKAFEEDSWQYIRFPSGAELKHITMTTRCLQTTNDPSTGNLSKKEPLVTLRKYRIPNEPAFIEKWGSLPCLGVGCGVDKNGGIRVGDEVLAVRGRQPRMHDKINKAA